MRIRELSITALIVLILTVSSENGQTNEIENKFIKAGLIDIHTIDSSIQVDLINSDPKKNYFRENYYNGLGKAYLRKEIAIKLSKAQKILKTRQPGYSLLILDAARPRSVSRRETGISLALYVSTSSKPIRNLEQ